MVIVVALPAGTKKWALPLCALGAVVLASCALEPGSGAGETEGLLTGQVFQDRFTDGSGQGPEMVVLPSGSFTMGSPESEVGRDDWEGPQRTVQIGYRLAVGRYEVTFAEWDACVADGGCNNYRPDDLGWGRDTRPVINVSWDDAQTYVEWLNRKTGLTGRDRYRLLTDAEWEYAARAGTTTAYSFGDDASQLDAHAWFEANSDNRTHPVGRQQPNAFGLYDMHGNVAEWVEDCFYGNLGYADAPTDGSARTFPDCDGRVLRGNSWYASPQNLRSAHLYRLGHRDRSNQLGFRVARTLPD